MFLRQEVILPLSFPAARAQVVELIRDGSLLAASGEAFADGGSATLRVGPFGEVPGVSKLVRVRYAEPVPHDDRLILPLRWEATGPAGRMFPLLDADITLTPADVTAGSAGAARQLAGQTRLVLTGSYRPPLDGFGAMADRVLMHRVAAATISSLLHKIARRISDAARSPAGQAQPATLASPHRERPA